MLIMDITAQYEANSNTSELFNRPFFSFYIIQKQRLRLSIKFSSSFDIEGTDKPITDEEMTTILKINWKTKIAYEHWHRRK